MFTGVLAKVQHIPEYLTMEPTRLSSYQMNTIIYREDELKGGEKVEPGGEEVEPGREEVEQEPEGRHGAVGHRVDQHSDRY